MTLDDAESLGFGSDLCVEAVSGIVGSVSGVVTTVLRKEGIQLFHSDGTCSFILSENSAKVMGGSRVMGSSGVKEVRFEHCGGEYMIRSKDTSG